MGEKRHIKFLQVGIMVFLFLPLFFQFVKVKEFTPLNGVQENKVQHLLDSTNNKLSWFKGSFQKYCDLSANENLSLKSPLIRLRNQIQYSFFEKINAQDIYEYNGILFRFYTKNYNESIHFMGESKAKVQIGKLKKIQDYLGKDIPIITIIAPSKTYFYRENLPPINQLQSSKSNYKYLKNLLLENQLPCIDFNTYFLGHKNSKTPIFGKGGIHWSSFAATLAMDSIVNYLSQLKNQDFQQPTWKLKSNFHFEYDDHDLAQLLNVFYPPNDQQVKSLSFTKPKNNKKKIKALIVSDSFFDVISKTELRNQIFTKDSEYLYYFAKRKDSQNGSQVFDKNELLSKIKTADCVIIMNDIVNMEDFSWGFIDELYKQIVLGE
jgi:hypothetical protein